MSDQLGLFADPAKLEPPARSYRFLLTFFEGLATIWLYGPRATAAQARHGREVGAALLETYRAGARGRV